MRIHSVSPVVNILAAHEGAVPLAALLDDAALRCVVDVGQAEAAQVAFRPFEVIQQAPGEIAFDLAARAIASRMAARWRIR
jgi:hypothetical protein